MHVPPGVTDGTGLRVPNKDMLGRNGARTGDLYVSVHVQPHAHSGRGRGQPGGSASRLPCTPGAGGRIEVPLSDGNAMRLSIPPGTRGR